MLLKLKEKSSDLDRSQTEMHQKMLELQEANHEKLLDLIEKQKNTGAKSLENSGGLNFGQKIDIINARLKNLELSKLD